MVTCETSLPHFGPAAEMSEESFEPRPLTEAERKEAWTAANFFAAEPNQEKPIALWVLGPSSVGKSTLTPQVAPRFGIANSTRSSVADERSQLNAVIIDGEFMRDAHGVYNSWVKTPDWRSAYPALKSIINKEKDAMATAASSERRNLVIPQTLLNLDKGLTEVVELTCQGYTNHVLAVVSPLEECRRRGQAREVTTGKRYEPREFDLSLVSLWPMITACNGRYELVRALEIPGETKRLAFDTLATGVCGSSPECEQVDSAAETLSGDNFYAVVEAAVGVSSRPTSPKLARRDTTPLQMPHLEDPTLAPRALTDEEREVAWQSANFYDTPSHLEKPIALWILGPPSVGKSSFVSQVAPNYEMLESADGLSSCVNGVVVDGNQFRDAHSVYQRWMTMPSRKAFAGAAFKSISNKEKDRLCTEASSRRKNIVIVRRLTDLNKGLTEMEELTWKKYTNEVIAVVASLQDCQNRAAAVGKSCDPVDYEKSMEAIPAMLAACDGRYAVVRSVEGDGASGPFTFEVCAKGHGKRTDETATSLAFATRDDLRGIVDAAVHHRDPAKCCVAA
eukprot:TRINITY_DN97666_c0_g1_i1.p1 TRINITY_DN97666_c0_g1~~TRINITY_DN97666_c0_g1_i1.p1  ORF type:complete len:564 (-),score=110.53 TRINITY_DN97666_c0_g1_i1:67-1758(-)